MKTLFPCTILALAFNIGAAELPPVDSFRLTIEEVVQSSACRVINLQIEARSAEMVAVRWDQGAGGSVGLADSKKGNARGGTVTLASMLGQCNTVCHTVTVLRAGGAQASNPLSFDVGQGTELASVVVVSITNGVYKLDRPLVIGTRNGETMKLVVGSWNSEQVSRKKRL